jgi:hypothetical protein
MNMKGAIFIFRQEFTGIAGLPLPRRAVRVLKDRGIFAHALVSIEHQQLAQRYVVRGLESGGPAGDVGRYVTFADGEGQPLEYLHPVEAIGVNGLHAVVMSLALVRADMLRKGRTYELLISRHSLSSARTVTGHSRKPKCCFVASMGASSWICAGKTRPRPVALSPHSIRWRGNPQRFRTSSWRSFELRPRVLIASAVPTHTTCGSRVTVRSAIARGMRLLRPWER